MEQDNIINTPDAVVVFPAGVAPLSDGGWRSTTYDESDAFGTLGGRDRVQAAALLARTYPNAYLVTTYQQVEGAPPQLIAVYAEEMRSLGVADERIITEGESTNTASSVQQAIRLAQERGWKHLVLLSNGYHLLRIAALYEQTKCDIGARVVSSESVLAQHDPRFADYFETIKRTPAYQIRLAAEKRGVEALQRGAYHAAPSEDKKERAV